jgi:hypothetical protein
MTGLAAINQSLLHQLEEIPDLRSFSYVPDTVSPPAAVIQPPRVRNNPADALIRRGDEVTMWRTRIPITLVLGRVSERDYAEQYDRYLEQLQRVLPKAKEPICHIHVAQLAELRQISVGGADYIAADVTVEVWA